MTPIVRDFPLQSINLPPASDTEQSGGYDPATETHRRGKQNGRTTWPVPSPRAIVPGGAVPLWEAGTSTTELSRSPVPAAFEVCDLITRLVRHISGRVVRDETPHLRLRIDQALIPKSRRNLPSRPTRNAELLNEIGL